MRVAVTGLHAETNTFLPIPGDFTAVSPAVRRGDEILSEFADSGGTIAGFLRACAGEGVAITPLVHVDLLASCGSITDQSFTAIADEIVLRLTDQGPFDVVLLAQHGAAVADGHPDADGELVRRVRAAVGADVTVAMTLDLHANVTDRMIDAVDVCVGYRENPHRDALARGTECATLALAHARGMVRPAQRLIRLPMVVPILGGSTDSGAMHAVMREVASLAGEHSLLSYSVFHGFGYADVPEMGSSVLAVADGDNVAASTVARAMAQVLWEARGGLLGEALAPADSIAEAQRRSHDGRPVVVLDVGDNVGGGSPGDSTILLSEALARDVPGFVATLCDQRAASKAIEAGAGAEVELELGPTSPVSAGPRLQVRGRVAQISEGRFENKGVVHAGLRYFNGGPTVRLSLEGSRELIITSRAVPSWSPEQLRAMGIEPARMRVIVAKGVVAPRAGYGSVTTVFVCSDTPGVTAADLTQFSYRRRPQPLWPLEPETEFDPDTAGTLVSAERPSPRERPQ